MRTFVSTMAVVLSLLLLTTMGCAVVEEVEEIVEEAAEAVEEVDSVEPVEPESPTPKPEEEEPSPPTPTATLEPEEEEPGVFEEEALTRLQQLDSYSTLLRMDWERDDGEWGFMEVVQEYVREPPAKRTLMRGHESEHAIEGETDIDSSFELVEVGGVRYMRYGGGEWTSYAVATGEVVEPPDLDIFEDWLRGDRGRLVGTERVDGVRARHYHLDSDDMGYLDEDMEEMLSAQADIWVSTEHDVVVKGILVVELLDEEGRHSKMTLEVRVDNINAPITITAPELPDAPPLEAPASHDDIPLMPGSQQTGAMMNMVMYAVDAPPGDVADFFRSEMPEYGWTEIRSIDDSWIHFEKGEATARITIVEMDDGSSMITVHVDAD